MQYGILDRTWIRKKAIQKKKHCEIPINFVLQVIVLYQGSFENCTLIMEVGGAG